MYENFKYRGKLLMDLFCKAASAGNPADFRRAMEMLHRADPTKDGHEKCDIIVKNLNESFNSCILPDRTMSIVSMMDWNRTIVMKMICSKRKCLQCYSGDICPNVLKIEKYKDLGRNCFLKFSDGRKFGVDCDVRHYVVDLENRTCTCKRFELTEILCQHAIAAIHLTGEMWKS